jgi:hypothetical protein
MKLPDDPEKVFWEEMKQYEEDRHMPYITRMGISISTCRNLRNSHSAFITRRKVGSF